MRRVIRADLDWFLSPSPTRARAFLRRSRRARERTRRAKPRKHGRFRPPAQLPSWARASGRAGEGDPLFCRRRQPRSARRSSAPRSALRGALRQRLALMSAAASAKILRAQRRRGGSARPALRRWRRTWSCGEAPVAVARPRRPAICVRRRPSRHSGGAARPRSARPERPRIQPEGLRRGGRSGLCRGQDCRSGVLRLPGRPSGRSRNPRPLGVRPRPRHPAALGRGPCR